MNLTDNAALNEMLVGIESLAGSGINSNWDYTDATLEAGDTTLAETDGKVVDGLAMGDSFIIYKEDSVWGMQLIGGQFVFRFYKIFSDVGLLNVNCVASFEGKHFVVGPNDIYVHNGSSKESVIDDRVRGTIYSRINDTYITRSFVVPDYRNREVLFCYCNASSGSAYPDEALVYNWDSGEISFRSLYGTAAIGYGEVSDAPTEVSAWDSDAGSWNSDSSEWGEVAGKPTERRMLIPHTTGQKFYADGRGETDGGTAFRAFVERVGLDFNDPRGIKHLYAIRPTIMGTGTVSIYAGGEKNPGEGYTWYGPKTFTIGTDHRVDFRGVSGRALSVRFESTADSNWELEGYQIEGTVKGAY